MKKTDGICDKEILKRLQEGKLSIDMQNYVPPSGGPVQPRKAKYVMPPAAQEKKQDDK